VPQVDSGAVRDGDAVALTREGAEALAKHASAVVRTAGSLDSAGTRAPLANPVGVSHQGSSRGPESRGVPAGPRGPTF
jgi:hypothetical protein